MLVVRVLLAVAHTVVCGVCFFSSSLRGGPLARSQALAAWSRRLLKCLKIHVQWPNDFQIQSGPRVVIANHVSTVDIFIIASRARPTVFLGKAELATWPILGPLLRASGMVFVNRQSLYSRGRALLELQSYVQQGFDVVIFPEGTTSVEGPRRKTHAFHSGALRISRMEEVPVEVFHLNYASEDRLAWVGDATLVSHLKDLFSARPKLCKIRTLFLKPIRDRQDQHAKRERIRRYLLEAGSNTISLL